MSHLADRVRRRLVESGGSATAAEVAAALRAEGLLLGDDAVLQVVSQLRRDLVGLGPLEALVTDPRVTDVVVLGDGTTWIDRGEGMECTSVRFSSESEVRRLAQRLAAQAGRRLDDASAMVDARLSDGTRLHAILPPIAVAGTLISLRIPGRKAFTLEDLVDAGTIDDVGSQVLRSLIDERLNFIVSGGTGSGKTTILATLLGLVSPRERLVIVEDSSELDPDHAHVARLQARLANAEGAGVVSLRDLVRQALRMRPDRIVVGEVRGPEVVDLLMAINTGHDGCCATIHANSTRDVPARLEALGLTAGLERHAVHALVSAGLDAIVHVQRDAGGVRRLASVAGFTRTGDGLVEARDIVAGDGRGLAWLRPEDAHRPLRRSLHADAWVG